jgi:hypothetical protein
VLLALHRARMASIYSDPLDIFTMCIDAAHAGDYETLAAVDAAPKWDPLFRVDRRCVGKSSTCGPAMNSPMPRANSTRYR